MDRLDRGHDADRRPRHRGQVGDLAGHVHAHLEDGRLVVGPSRSSVSGRPISLFWLPSVLSVRTRAPRTVATASLVEVLAMLPGDPDDQRIEPPAPAGRDGTERGQGVGDADDRDVPERPGVLDLPGDEQRAAPRSTASSRWRWPSVRSPGSATNS